MQMTLILLLAITIGSHSEQTIEANPGCENVPNLVYYVAAGLVCVPSDVIYLSSFEDEF